jgi:hypothetical protein
LEALIVVFYCDGVTVVERNFLMQRSNDLDRTIKPFHIRLAQTEDMVNSSQNLSSPPLSDGGSSGKSGDYIKSLLPHQNFLNDISVLEYRKCGDSAVPVPFFKNEPAMIFWGLGKSEHKNLLEKTKITGDVLPMLGSSGSCKTHECFMVLSSVYGLFLSCKGYRKAQPGSNDFENIVDPKTNQSLVEKHVQSLVCKTFIVRTIY